MCGDMNFVWRDYVFNVDIMTLSIYYWYPIVGFAGLYHCAIVKYCWRLLSICNKKKINVRLPCMFWLILAGLKVPDPVS